ncbi:hypothetical protein [Polycladidibacter stylochi]|uniref:hypothetical protein n=1 Tax=Polycladidibacter stylochi TaxID=1807766 RepID=UPI0008360FB8|nr:hypothetical protein [Pseudovibrio stylochi]
MFSVILYGRNDNYGYNLHKRAAISLNCIAQVLNDKDDEIIFVDYNTPNGFPSFPEAIADTLTPKVHEKLRIIRVPSNIHDDHFAGKTHLKALEPVARNVALRHSNPSNRWVLSTNTDMIFLPKIGDSLNSSLQGLADGAYCTPRFEIPETLWEGWPRQTPQKLIENVAYWGERAHLNEVVTGSSDIRYDAPGDFQLMLRRDLFEINGFDEEMLLGWHVDSNIFKRLGLIYGEIGDAFPYVWGYHCDHTRQITPAHKHNAPQNSTEDFVTNVQQAKLEKQNDWGLKGLALEELSLRGTASIFLEKQIEKTSAPSSDHFINHYRADSYAAAQIDPFKTAIFINDIIGRQFKTSEICWIGPEDHAHQYTEELLGEEIPVLTSGLPPETTRLFIVNYGCPEAIEGAAEKRLIKKLENAFFWDAHQTAKGFSPCYFIGVNAIHNDLEGLLLQKLVCAKTPFATHLRHGPLNEHTRKAIQLNSNLISDQNQSSLALSSPNLLEEWLTKGPAAIKLGHILKVKSGRKDFAFLGGIIHLGEGSYDIQLELIATSGSYFPIKNKKKIAILEVLCDNKRIAGKPIFLSSLDGIVNLQFYVDKENSYKNIEFRLFSKGKVSFVISGVKLKNSTSKIDRSLKNVKELSMEVSHA